MVAKFHAVVPPVAVIVLVPKVTDLVFELFDEKEYTVTAKLLVLKVPAVTVME